MKLQDHSLTTIVTDYGFRRLYSLPTASELEAYYSEVYYQENKAQYESSYTTEEIAWFRLEGKIADYIYRSTYPQITNPTCLDVGCGEGFISAELSSLSWNVRCCDFSSFGISRCNPSLLANFQRANIYEYLDSEIAHGNTYDLVNLANVLEHVLDPIALLGSLRQMLSPSGLLRIVVPNDFSPFQEYLKAQSKLRTDYWLTPEHLSYFNFANLEALFAKQGFEINHLLSDFPIENYIMNDFSNYKELGPSVGKQAHLARCKIDLFFSQDLPSYISFLAAQAKLGIGRDIIAYVR